MAEYTMTRGVEFLMVWRWVLTDEAKNLTGYSISIRIRPFEESKTVLYSFDRDSEYVTVNDLDGSVSLFLPPSVTLSYDFQTACIDCLIINADDTDGEKSLPYTINLIQ